MWLLLIVAGVVFLIAAGIIWAVMTGRLHFLAKRFSERASPGLTQRAARAVAAETLADVEERPAVELTRRAREAPEQVAADLEMPITTRLANLRIGSVIKIETIDGRVTGEVEGVITHRELYKISDKWQPTGDTFALVRLTGGQWLHIRGGEVKLFAEERQISDGELADFKGKARLFGQSRQRRKSVQVSYHGTSFDLVDIGMSQLEPEGLVDVGGRARFILAESRDGQVLWVEERRDGPDVIMLGAKVALSDIKDIL